MKIKPATPKQAEKLQLAVDYLRHARNMLSDADCPQALDTARRALKSAEGAQRHMLRRLQHRDPVTGEPLRAMFIPALPLLEPGHVTEAQENAYNARRCI